MPKAQRMTQRAHNATPSRQTQDLEGVRLARARAGDLARGSFTAIIGCMFSGKTTELLNRLAQYPSYSTLTIKHRIDVRYSLEDVVSHTGLSLPATVVDSTVEIQESISEGVQLVALDEGHFFGEGLAECVSGLLDRGIDILLTSLDLDSWGRPFPLVDRLVSLADETVIRRGLCARCGRDADRTQRLTPIVDGNMVGGIEDYECRCRSCWKPPHERAPQWPG